MVDVLTLHDERKGISVKQKKNYQGADFFLPAN